MILHEDFKSCLRDIRSGAISPHITVSQFAEKNRKIKPPGHKVYEYFNFDNTPYLRWPCDLFSSFDSTRSLTVVKGARLGFTEGFILNVGTYNIVVNPCPQLFVSADQKLIDRFAKLKLKPVIHASGFDKYIRATSNNKKNKNKSSGDTAEMLEYGNGDYWVFSGANNPNNFRQIGFQVVFLDERATYRIIDAEGDVGRLAEGRQGDYGLYAKTASVSTPTITGGSFYEDFLAGSQHEWRVHCPLCGGMQYLEFAKFSDKDEKGNRELLQGLSFEHESYELRSEPMYKCKHCLQLFPNSELYNINLTGEWQTDKKYVTQEKSARITGLYSKFNTWDEIAKKFLQAKREGTPAATQSFKNLILGEFFEFKQKIIQIRTDLGEEKSGYHRSQVPPEVGIITCVADVQVDRIEVEIKGWGINKQSYSIEYLKFDGDTNESEVWNEYENFIFNKCVYAGLRPELFLIDSGDGNKTADIEDFCRRCNIRAQKESDNPEVMVIMPLKGQSPKQINNKPWGVRTNEGLQVFRINTYHYKKQIIDFLNRKKKDDEEIPFGFCNFPNDYPDEYYNQLKSEKYIESIDKNGYPVTKWEKLRDRNEALDLFVYNLALIDYLMSEMYIPVFEAVTNEPHNYNSIINHFINQRAVA